jgi:hypothetical protein
MKKAFDSVKMVRAIRNKFYLKTKTMTNKEKLAYHKQQAQELYAELGFKK